VISGVVVVLLAVASAALALVARRFALKSTKEAIATLRRSLLARLYAMPLSWFDDVDEGMVHATVVQDTERLDAMGAAVAAQLLPSAVIGAALTAALAVVAPMLFLVLLGALPFIAVAIRLPTAAIRRLTRSYQQVFDRFSVRVGFAVRAAMLIRSDGAQQREVDAADKETAAVAEAGRRLFWMHYASAQLSGLMTTVAGMIVLVVGAIQMANGRLTSGTLVAFYALILPLRGQLAVILTALPLVVSGSESLARLEALLPPSTSPLYDGAEAVDFRGNVEMTGVTFGYRRGRPVLLDANLRITAGEVVGLAGANGAGKSTVASLLLGLRRPQVGDVRAEGVSYERLDVDAVRRRIGLLPQNPFLFPSTVEDNIAFATGATRDDVRRAAELAGADELISRLPDGYDGGVGDHGKLLSGGEEQRLAIARAVVRRPALLILDEPTTHLDMTATHNLVRTLRALDWRPAVLVISHDDEVLATADRVYELVAGRLTQRQTSPS
jgi:ATP-binding cassette subfamily B protein